jgi:hypothetical protein
MGQSLFFLYPGVTAIIESFKDCDSCRNRSGRVLRDPTPAIRSRSCWCRGASVDDDADAAYHIQDVGLHTQAFSQEGAGIEANHSDLALTAESIRRFRTLVSPYPMARIIFR